MKTIEIKSGDQTVQFTTKSVTLDGKEYFYADITELYHSPVVHTYQFECYGETKKIIYEKKDAKILNAIFSQVKNLEVKKAAAETEKPVAPVKEEAPVVEEAPVAETPAEEVKEEAKPEENSEEATSEEEKHKKSAKETFASLVDTLKKKAASIKNPAEGDAKEETEKEPMDPEKKERLKKSLRVFGIILAAVIVVSVIYYFVFGTANAPTDTNPTNIESQQYDDIDQLIEDMQ